jgi:hypothetical protein
MLDWDGCPAHPDRNEAERLLAELAFLIEAGGHERFTVRRVVAPNPRDFPEPWVPTADGVRHLLRRLFWHGDLDLAVQVDDLRGAPGGDGLTSTEILFCGIDDGKATFELHTIGNDDVLGILCHVTGAAHAAAVRPPDHPFRGGERPDTQEEGARCGSIAAVYLGLGVPAANAAQYQRTWSAWKVQYASHETQIDSAGGLPSTSLAFLLAVQATVRGEEIAAHRALYPNQAADTAAWREALAGQGDALRRRLGVPPPSTWQAASDAHAPYEEEDHDGDDLDGDGDADHDAAPDSALALTGAQDLARLGDAGVTLAEDQRRLRRFNVGRRVYRVRHARAWSRGLLLSGPALAGAMIATGSVPIAVAASIAGVVGGMAWGRRSLWFQCSDARCRSHLQRTDERCPLCGGTVAAEIGDADERLELDEQFEQAEAEARRLEAAPQLTTSEPAPR